MSVGFCTAVSYSDPQTVSQKLLGFADSYLYLGCGRVEVISGFTKDGREAVINDSSASSCLITALKVLSYFYGDPSSPRSHYQNRAALLHTQFLSA